MVVETRRRKASASVKQLPQDVLNDILSRLPIKDLLRYRCVSKSWLHLLSYDPHFNRLHSDRILQDNKPPGIVALTAIPHKLYYAPDYTVFDKAIEFDMLLNKFNSSAGVYSIVGICNGLICLKYHRNPHADHSSRNVYVWNPLTSHHIRIPCPPVTSKIRFYYYSFGFGFDEVKDEYKVIRLIWTSRKVCPRIHIYTLGTGSWRTLKEIPYGFGYHDNSHVPFVNGALHWIASNLASPSLEIILSFDVKDECFQEIPLPNGVLDDNQIILSVHELDGQLSIICIGGNQNVQLWVMEVYAVEGSWIKQRQIELQNAPYLSFGGFEPLGLASDREIITYSPQGLSLYNSESSSITKLKQFDVRVHDAFTYHGRLTSLKSYHEFSERKMPRKKNRKTEPRGT